MYRPHNSAFGFKYIKCPKMTNNQHQRGIGVYRVYEEIKEANPHH